MVFVYFESDSHAELRALFAKEEDYMLSLPTLEVQAKKEGMKVTESMSSVDVNLDLLETIVDFVKIDLECGNFDSENIAIDEYREFCKIK